MARNLRLKRTNAIGVIFPLGHEVGQLVSDPFVIAILGHITDGVTARGCDLPLTRIVPTDDSGLDALVSSGRVDGVIVIGQSNQRAAITRVAARYAPIMVWGERHPAHGYCSVGTDNVAGGAIATGHLLTSGRRRIVFAGHGEVPEITARYRGFLGAHAEAASKRPASFPRRSRPTGRTR